MGSYERDEGGVIAGSRSSDPGQQQQQQQQTMNAEYEAAATTHTDVDFFLTGGAVLVIAYILLSVFLAARRGPWISSSSEHVTRC